MAEPDPTTRRQRLARLLANTPAHVPPASASQEVYDKKLAADLERTEQFLAQAQAAVTGLSAAHQVSPELANADPLLALPPGWTTETLAKAHRLALYEVYKLMPYHTAKNDSLGLATALTVTQQSVAGHTLASDGLEQQNQAAAAAVAELRAILHDYTTVGTLLDKRLQQYPEKVAAVRQKLEATAGFEDEAAARAELVSELHAAAKVTESRMYLHLLRVVTKMYAYVDWEHASAMDEDVFAHSLRQAVVLVETLVGRIGAEQPWVAVDPASTERRLVDLLLRHDVLVQRDTPALQVKLRDYGVP